MIARRVKKIFVSVLFVCFFYFFVHFGFQQNLHPNFGENLDRNQIDSAKSKNVKKLQKFKHDSDEHNGEAAIWNSIGSGKKDEKDEKILKEFLDESRHENLKSQTKHQKKKFKHRKKKQQKTKTEILERTKRQSHETKKSLENLVIKELSTKKVQINQHDNIPLEFEQQPSGEKSDFGEYGTAVTLPPDAPDNIKKLVENGWKKHEFNEYISSLISVNRSLLDFRSEYCHDIHNSYLKDLPSVSVIIVFYNEAWSTLVRTIQSVTTRSPENLIQEIILVDDFSDLPHLKDALDDYVKKSTKMQIIRNKRHEGLIRARNIGATSAKADIFVFLDSHVECTIGWLEPLVDRIASNKTSIAVPVIEAINDETFELIPRDHSHYVSLGGFGWDLKFRWFYMKSSSRKHAYAPISTPTIAGGLFAVSAEFFRHVGMYDPGLELWGGENLELSFKAWMCGGSIQVIPCSHVGHVYRKKSPYDWPQDTFRKNCMRVANVWMDDYVKFFKYATGFDEVDYGNVTDRIKLRENLQCNNFSWYLSHVYPERSIPSQQLAYGQIVNLGYNKSMCLDGKADKSSSLVSAFKCEEKGGTQYWEYNGQIYRDNYCLTYKGNELITQHCRKKDTQQFKYNEETQQLILDKNSKCLTVTADFYLTIENCDEKIENQKWKLENFDRKREQKQ